MRTLDLTPLYVQPSKLAHTVLQSIVHYNTEVRSNQVRNCPAGTLAPEIVHEQLIVNSTKSFEEDAARLK